MERHRSKGISHTMKLTTRYSPTIPRNDWWVKWCVTASHNCLAESKSNFMQQNIYLTLLHYWEKAYMSTKKQIVIPSPNCVIHAAALNDFQLVNIQWNPYFLQATPWFWKINKSAPTWMHKLKTDFMLPVSYKKQVFQHAAWQQCCAVISERLIWPS